MQLSARPVKPLLTIASILQDALLDTFIMVQTAIAFQHVLLVTMPILHQANVVSALPVVSYAMEEELRNAPNAK